MKQKTYTYKELHNRAVTTFRKSLSSFLVVAIMNFLGVILSLMRGNNDFIPSLISNILIFRLLSNVIENSILFYAVITLISLAFSCLFVFIWSISKTGNIKAIIAGAVIYIIDAVLLLIFYLADSYLIPQLFLHVIVIIFIIISIVSYYHVLAIERKFKSK